MLELVTSANVACGFHAGDPSVIRETLTVAARHGVTVGAHPSYPDLVGFGRRAMDATPAEVTAMVIYQIGAVAALARSAGTVVRYVKPHGALYNRAAEDEVTAQAIVQAIKAVDPSLILLGLDGSPMLRVAQEAGVNIAREAFVDRAYLPNGALLPRGQPGAVLDDPDHVAERALRMVQEHYVTAVDRTRRIIRPDSLCVHGDGPRAVAIVRAVRDRFQEAGIAFAPFVR